MFFEQIKSFIRSAVFRITLWHAGTFILGAIIVFVTAYFLLSRSIDEQTEDTIEFRFKQYASEYARGKTTAIIELTKLRTGRAQKAFFLRLATPDNKTIFLRDADDWSDFHPEVLAEQPVADDFVWSELTGDDGEILKLASDRLDDGSILQVGKTMELRRELLASFRTTLLVIALVVVIGGIVGGTITAAKTLRPVQHLTASVQSIITTGTFDARVTPEKTGDEIDKLVGLFNVMLEKIDLLIRSMRDSLDNVAHDLRTPMTRLRNVATTAIERDANKEECHEAFGDCLEESERVMTMLFTLMDIAEAESGVMKLERSPISVSTLADQVNDLYQHVAEEKNIQLDVSVPGDLTIRADSGRIQRALGNLVDNAIKYTQENRSVAVTAWAESNSVIIEVSDNGEGIPENEIPRIWERLYRVDKSRSQRGLGLGLSFVKAIVEAHEGTVSAQSTIEKGSRFRMTLPA